MPAWTVAQKNSRHPPKQNYGIPVASKFPARIASAAAAGSHPVNSPTRPPARTASAVAPAGGSPELSSSSPCVLKKRATDVVSSPASHNKRGVPPAKNRYLCYEVRPSILMAMRNHPVTARFQSESESLLILPSEIVRYTLVKICVWGICKIRVQRSHDISKLAD